MPRILDRLSMLTTADCSTACPYCCVKDLRRRHQGYQMPLADVERLIRRCRDLDVRYQRINPSGGEPTEWKHFAEASQMLHDADIADELFLMTSLSRPDVLEPVIHLYPGENCYGLDTLLSHSDILPRHLLAIKDWLSGQMTQV